MESHSQLTLEVGGEVGAGLSSTFAIGGAIVAEEQAAKGDQVRVVVTDIDGNVLATALGYVGAISFIEHRDKNVKWTERAHKVKLAKDE